MSAWLSILVGLIYSGVSIDQAMMGNQPGAVVYAAYAVAAVAMIGMLK